MATDLAHFVAETALCDTHEHLRSEDHFTGPKGPDILTDLFEHYIGDELIVAGATPEALRRMLDTADPDIAGRFAGVSEAVERCRHTGYGSASHWIAREIYEIDELTPTSLEAAAPKTRAMAQPGQRLRILRDVARLDHVQVNHFRWDTPPDFSGPDFFLYDLHYSDFACGRLNFEAVERDTGVAVRDAASFDAAVQTLFERWGPTAVAIKSPHAYGRTLAWRPRTPAEVDPLISRHASGESLSYEEHLAIGDYGLARGAELCIQFRLPFKIHTGYFAGHSRMRMGGMRPSLLCDLLASYPECRFVLMHTGYPYAHEMIALAKHYPNVYADMCWAWSIDPSSSCDFLRRAIHAVPAHKVLVFGGDTFWPNMAAAYAAQARQWLTRALQQEVDDGLLTEREAIAFAGRVMRRNQYDLFDLEATRAAIQAAMAVV